MSKHIQNLKVASYKGIHNLSMDELNDINILTGDNNSGKTSVLEILSTLNNPQYTDSWLQGTRMLGTRWLSRSYLDGFYNLFPVGSDSKEISYEFYDEKGDRRKVLVQAFLDRTQISTEELNSINGMSLSRYNGRNDNIIVDVDCLYLTFYINGDKLYEETIYEQQHNIRRNHKNNKLITTVYVSPIDHASGSYNISRVFTPENYAIMMDMVRTFDKDIVQISAVSDEEVPSLVNYKVFSNKYKEPLLLNDYGDGMKKSIFLLNAVSKAKDGILLIDEFETGIHTSAMDQVFCLLLENALKYNVQVFMTSHSKEAIDKVLRCKSQLQKNVNLYTLYKYEGQSYARKFSCAEAIRAQENLGLELR